MSVERQKPSEIDLFKQQEARLRSALELLESGGTISKEDARMVQVATDCAWYPKESEMASVVQKIRKMI